MQNTTHHSPRKPNKTQKQAASKFTEDGSTQRICKGGAQAGYPSAVHTCVELLVINTQSDLIAPLISAVNVPLSILRVAQMCSNLLKGCSILLTSRCSALGYFVQRSALHLCSMTAPVWSAS